MAAPTAPEWVFNIADPDRSGLLQSFVSEAKQSPGFFVRNDGNSRRIRLVVPSSAPTPSRPYQEVDLSGGATVELAIGAVDLAPTSGTFNGVSNAVTTGLIGLAYNITAAALQTALNLNGDVTSGGVTVSVAKYDTVYVITWSAVGARNLISWDGAALSPECTCSGTRIQTGDASHVEIQALRVIQRPYAYISAATAYPVAAATVTQIQTGTVSVPSIQRIALSPEPYDGSFTFGSGSVSVQVPFDATAEDFQALAGAGFVIEKTGTFIWDITFVALGAKSAVTAGVTALIVPTGRVGDLNLSTVQTAAAFSTTTAEYISAILEGQITFTGGTPMTFFRMAVDIYRDVIDFSTLSPTPSAPLPIANGGTGATTAAGARTNLGVPASTVAGKYRFKTDGTFQLWNADQSLFHTLTVTGLAGLENLSISAGEA